MLTTLQISVTYSHRIGSYTGVSIWSSIEMFVAVTCACLPTLRPVWQYSSSKLILLITSAISLSRSGHGAGESKTKDTFVLASKDKAAPFQRLPDPHIDNPSPLIPVKAKIGHMETANWDLDAERGDLFDDRNDR